MCDLSTASTIKNAPKRADLLFRCLNQGQDDIQEIQGSPSKTAKVSKPCRRIKCLLAASWSPLHIGMLLVAAGAIFRSLQGLSVVFLARRSYHFWTITCMHGVSGSLFCVLLAMAKSPAEGARSLLRAVPGNREILFLRAALGGVTSLSAFYAVSYMDLGQATVIMAMSPLFTAAMLSCFDGGSWNMSNTLAAVICLGGMVLMTKSPPFFSRPSQAMADMLPGLLASFGSAMSLAGINVVVRKTKEDLLVLTFWGMVGSLVLALPGCIQEQLAGSSGAAGLLLSWDRPGFWSDLAPALPPGLMGCCAALAKTRALQICHVVSILVILYLEPVCALYWDWAVLDAKVDITTVLGVLVIIVGCVVSVLSDTSSHHPPLSHYHHHPSQDAAIGDEDGLELDRIHATAPKREINPLLGLLMEHSELKAD